jgi:hypothetical protein
MVIRNLFIIISDIYKVACSNQDSIDRNVLDSTSLKNTIDKEKPYSTNILINENQTATGSVSGVTAPKSTKSSNENYEKCTYIDKIF